MAAEHPQGAAVEILHPLRRKLQLAGDVRERLTLEIHLLNDQVVRGRQLLDRLLQRLARLLIDDGLCGIECIRRDLIFEGGVFILADEEA